MANNLSIRGISAFPPKSAVDREGGEIIVEGGLTLYYSSSTSALTTTKIDEDVDVNVVSLEGSTLNALEANTRQAITIPYPIRTWIVYD